MSHKTPQVQEKVGTVVASNAGAQLTRVVTTGTPGTGRRTAMFVLNEPTQTLNRISQQNQTATIHSDCKNEFSFIYFNYAHVLS